MANFGWVRMEKMPSSSRSNSFFYFPNMACSVVHCWPSQPTNCRWSSQIGQCFGGSDSGNCVPQVGQIGFSLIVCHFITPRAAARGEYDLPVKETTWRVVIGCWLYKRLCCLFPL